MRVTQVQGGAAVDARNAHGDTALMFAASSNSRHLALALRLLKVGRLPATPRTYAARALTGRS